MDAYDPERRERLVAFIGRLRKLCIEGGAHPAVVAGLSAHRLLELWAEQQARADRERAELDRLMRQPPEAA
jgi:hypothetical protein